MPASRSRRKRLNRVDRELSLLDAAAGIVAAGGVEALTMEAIAERAGINKALVYRFFANRDAVLLALWDRETASFDARIQAAIARAQGLEGKLTAILDVWMDRLEAGGSALTRLEAPGIGPPELELRRQARTEATLIFLAGVMTSAYRLSQQDAVTAAAVLGAGSQGLIALRAHTGWSRRRLTKTFVRFCMGAIEKVAR